MEFASCGPATKRVCRRPVVADTGDIAALANEVGALKTVTGNPSQKLRRVAYSVNACMKKPDDRTFSLSPDERKIVRFFLDRGDQGGEDEGQSNRQLANERIHSRILLTFLAHHLNIGLDMEKPDADWVIRIFILLSCIHKEPLDPMSDSNPDTVHREVREILTKGFNLLTTSQEKTDLVPIIIKSYHNLRQRQRSVMSRLYAFQGDGLLSDIMSWESVSIQPHASTQKTLARCYITHRLFPVQVLMQVTVTMYNSTQLVFPIHVTLAPFLTVFQFYINMGPVLANNYGNILDNPTEWLDELARIYHLSDSALPAFLTAISCLDNSATLELLITE